MIPESSITPTLDRIFDQPKQPLAVLLLAIILLLSFHVLRPNERTKFIESLPQVGVKNRSFARRKTQRRSFKETEAWMIEGDQKYSKNIPFVVHNARKGQCSCSNDRCDRSLLHSGDPAVYPNNYEVDFIRKHITKKFHLIARDLQDELFSAMGDLWGTSEDTWNEVEIWKSLQRILVCGLISTWSAWLKPVIGPYIARHNRAHREAAIKLCLPIVRARLENVVKKKASPSFDWDPPIDILQWIIDESCTVGDPDQLKPRRIAHRLVVLNFNVVQGGAFPLNLVFTDICSGPDSEENLKRLRQECESVLNDSLLWSKDRVSQLVLLDSTIRESMRFLDFGLHALPRVVGSKSLREKPRSITHWVSGNEGTLLDNGIKVPKGVQIEIPMHGIHFDEENYPDAKTFRPFRFADGTSQPRSMTSLEETFLGFGYGRASCLGCFVGAHMMKVILAYFILHYEVESRQVRPHRNVRWEFRIPLETSILKIRRRQRI